MAILELYWKEALGKDGEPIRVPKIRTMTHGADDLRAELVESCGLDGLGKIVGDPTITHLGRILRPTRLDELPQFYSLAKGDISLVGLRPRSRREWLTEFPRELMDKQMLFKPGLLPPEFAYLRESSTRDEQIRRELEYVDRKMNNPIRTDQEYLARIAAGIAYRSAGHMVRLGHFVPKQARQALREFAAQHNLF
ncbi:MAG: sugar transferase [Candidatus Woesearchaeota archaeon]